MMRSGCRRVGHGDRGGPATRENCTPAWRSAVYPPPAPGPTVQVQKFVQVHVCCLRNQCISVEPRSICVDGRLARAGKAAGDEGGNGDDGPRTCSDAERSEVVSSNSHDAGWIRISTSSSFFRTVANWVLHRGAAVAWGRDDDGGDSHRRGAGFANEILGGALRGPAPPALSDASAHVARPLRSSPRRKRIPRRGVTIGRSALDALSDLDPRSAASNDDIPPLRISGRPCLLPALHDLGLDLLRIQVAGKAVLPSDGGNSFVSRPPLAGHLRGQRAVEAGDFARRNWLARSWWPLGSCSWKWRRGLGRAAHPHRHLGGESSRSHRCGSPLRLGATAARSARERGDRGYRPRVAGIAVLKLSGQGSDAALESGGILINIVATLAGGGSIWSRTAPSGFPGHCCGMQMFVAASSCFGASACFEPWSRSK